MTAQQVERMSEDFQHLTIRQRIETIRHHRLTLLFGLMAVFFTTAAPACNVYNGGGISLNMMQDEAWVPEPEL